MTVRIWLERALGAALGMMILPGAPARAEPWVATGDIGLRDDVETLAAFGVIPGPVTSWPIPVAQIASGVASADPATLPPHVARALARVRAALPAPETEPMPQVTADLAAANRPALVRDFSGGARDRLDASASIGSGWKTGYAKLQVGYQGTGNHGQARLDGSYIAQSLGNWLVYAGAIDQWWGPGWASSLILSNNARPMPRVGIMRQSPKPIDFPVLRWLGPWRFSGSVAVMDGPRPDFSDPYLFNLRFEFMPVRGVEIGLFHDGQLCGQGRPCAFRNWLESFGVAGLSNAINSGNPDTDPGNVMSGVDLRARWRMGDYAASVYGQIYAEDSSSTTFFKDTARQAGASIAGPLGASGWSFRAIGEYSDTMGVKGVLGGGDLFNSVYDHYIYSYGYRYRGKAVGASLDNDSRLSSAMLGLNAPGGSRYWLKYHHAVLNADNGGYNAVSLTRETINIVEASAETPTRLGRVKLSARVQDDAPDTPGRKHAVAAVEGGWSVFF